MSTTPSDRLRALLEPPATASGLDLEEVEVTPAGKRRVLRVVVDSDSGVSLDAVAAFSRRISETLDESDAMGGAPYTLEVTSPGTDRPLTGPRQFRRNIGRLIAFTLVGGGELTARLLSLDEDGMDLEVPGVKGRKPTARRLELAEVAKARVEVEFNRKATDAELAQGEQDDDADDEDEYDEEHEDEHDDADLPSAEIDESTEEA
ncbi:ribosome maturation factor RimP [Streptantibioticus silvisoli]|uniref:Ribosome maturation factor RimP n=1 Tax=Streptantibioticus silvisoli TaxID=2705255 RepID=A0ABT6W4W6_9ACTN|nr:ribosome maturation factor RimP [Streptantibioticus silvisoli]MDI5965314.1 ribosome maturation factor RimP [Streptantibioticus silvisoli]